MFLDFHNYIQKRILSEEAVKGTGGHTAVAGTTFEHVLTHMINYYGTQKTKGYSHEKALAATLADHSRVRPTKIKDENHPIRRAINKLGREEYDRVAWDAKHAAVKVINHINQHHGDIVSSELPTVSRTGNLLKKVKAASHMGLVTGGGGDVQKVLGKKTNADVIVNVHNASGDKKIRILGTSLKYATSADPGTVIKVHSPTASTMTKIIEDHHTEMHGKPYGLEHKIEHEKQTGENESLAVQQRHHHFLKDIFGEGEATKNYKGETAYYHTKKSSGGKIGLNDAALSQVREIVRDKAGKKYPEHVREKAKNFYQDLTDTNNRMKTRISNHFASAIGNVLNNTHAHPNGKRIANTLFRRLVNIPERRNKQNLETILVSATRKTDKDTGKRKSPRVEVFHASRAVRNHLDNIALSGGKHEIRNDEEATTFKIGPVRVTPDLRPGSKAGAVNVTYDKKGLRKIGDY